MKYAAAAAFLAFISASNAHDTHWNRHHAELAHKRQAVPTSFATGSGTTSTTYTTSTSPSTTTTTSATGATSTLANGTTLPINTVSGAPGAIPLNNLTSGMPTAPTDSISATYPPGAKPTYAGAPGLPSFVYKQGDWPAQDVVVDTTTSQVATWMKELQGHVIPDIPTTDGTCAGSPNSTANAAVNGWWSCGHYTRATDIVACPDKNTWGVSFDDGPAPYTQTLLNYLTQKNIFATFFVVGSRVIEYPKVLVEEYMAGHEISVHTWSHRPLTSLTNEQIVGELGWTRAAIKAVLGVTPTTMRPPYGDIDDRVRAISLAMGLTPIIWTSTPQAGAFDTNDWRVAGGIVTGAQAYSSFQAILGNASTMDTGFIVLEHDLYQVTVDMATGYTLNAALTHNPPFTLEPIGQCVKMPVTDLYRETTTNKSFPYPLPSGATDPTSTGAGSNVATSAAFSFNIPLKGMLLILGLLAWVL